jgi:hypothetical protein
MQRGIDDFSSVSWATHGIDAMWLDVVCMHQSSFNARLLSAVTFADLQDCSLRYFWLIFTFGFLS